ncbi:MAG TPA: glycosyltransferase family 1 protein [Solirubrobacteraceae bacterium]|nr:glycosyltransferase family 1 protein [Solirubrobacteraceae bacterium]
MRVGLDLLYLVPGETGGRESYARELIPALLEHDPELELVAFLNREAGPRLAAELGDRVSAVALPVSTASRSQWALGELALVPAAARRARVELVHAMANFGPSWGGFRRLVTIHDLQYRATPELLSRPARTATHALVSLAARAAHRIIAVSAAGRDEIVAGLGVERERIDVIPNGVRPAPPSVSTAGLRDRHRLGQRRVVLSVATNIPHKNLPVLIDALALMDAAERPVLMFAGHGTDDGSLRDLAAAAGMADDVRLLGSRSTEQLDSLYALAACLVLPTLHEGFGLPVIEAMARSLPVACSDIPALREVAGPAALYFDPRSPAQVAERISQLLRDADLSRRLRELGRPRAAQFSWAKAARATLESYRRTLGRQD